jgi:LPXTG-motif cell wall-anchored protein
MPIEIVVVPGPIVPVVEGNTITTLMLLLLAAAVGWLLWRRK